MTSHLRRFTLLPLALIIASLSAAAQNYVVVDKPNNMIYVYTAKDSMIFEAPVTVGTNYGQKTRQGDRKTPEGTFRIKQIQDASSWTHDFKDGGGVRKGAYGPFFHRLAVPGNNSIGIHGTCFPEMIGQRGSEGCIRLNNDDLVKFNKLVKVGTLVTVLPDLSKEQREAAERSKAVEAPVNPAADSCPATANPTDEKVIVDPVKTDKVASSTDPVPAPQPRANVNQSVPVPPPAQK